MASDPWRNTNKKENEKPGAENQYHDSTIDPPSAASHSMPSARPVPADTLSISSTAPVLSKLLRATSSLSQSSKSRASSPAMKTSRSSFEDAFSSFLQETDRPIRPLPKRHLRERESWGEISRRIENGKQRRRGERIRDGMDKQWR